MITSSARARTVGGSSLSRSIHPIAHLPSVHLDSTATAACRVAGGNPTVTPSASVYPLFHMAMYGSVERWLTDKPTPCELRACHSALAAVGLPLTSLPAVAALLVLGAEQLAPHPWPHEADWQTRTSSTEYRYR